MAFLKLLLLQAQLALVKKAFDFRRWSNDAVGGDSCRTGTERVIPASLSIGQRGKMVEVPTGKHAAEMYGSELLRGIFGCIEGGGLLLIEGSDL